MNGDQRGEAALHHLPGESARGEWLLVMGKSLRETDAWTLTTFKTSTLYHCGQGSTLTFEPPEGAGGDTAKNRFADLLGQMPDGFHVASESSFGGTSRGGVILSSIDLRDEKDAENAADAVYLRAEAYGKQVAKTTAEAVAVLASNSLVHGKTSSVGVVVTVAFERETRTVQVVCSDIAEKSAEPADAEEFLKGIRQTTIANHSSLAHLVKLSNKRGAAVLTLATSAGRLRWGNGRLESETTFFVPGFTSSLAINVDR